MSNDLNLNASVKYLAEDAFNITLFEKINSFISGNNYSLTEGFLTSKQPIEGQGFGGFTKENLTETEVLIGALFLEEVNHTGFDASTNAKEMNQMVLDEDKSIQGKNKMELNATELIERKNQTLSDDVSIERNISTETGMFEEEYHHNYTIINELEDFVIPDLFNNDNADLHSTLISESIEGVEVPPPFASQEDTELTFIKKESPPPTTITKLVPDFNKNQKGPDGSYDLVGHYNIKPYTMNPVDVNLLSNDTMHLDDSAEKDEKGDESPCDNHQTKNAASMLLISIPLILVLSMTTI